jgi:putative ABC transport system permease protein
LLFTTFSVIIACLGLAGSIANRIISKTKEIGIRKVLGAGTSNIAAVLLNASLMQFGVASVIGLPLGFLVGEQYLQRYSLRIDLSWWHGLFPIGLLAIIMLIFIATAVVRAAKANPIRALKCE